MNQQDLDLQVDELYNFEGNKLPFFDGIINEEKYYKSNLKILWICKEPYDKREDETIRFSLRDEINTSPRGYYTIKIMRRIALASYCILNNATYSEALADSDVSLALQSIAYINLSKLPALTNSSGREGYFSKVYDKCKPVLLKQIDQFEPDIVIFGATCYHFMKDLGLDFNEGKNLEYQDRSVFYHDGKLFIDSCHPSFIGKPGEEKFCKSIYEAVQTWAALR